MGFEVQKVNVGEGSDDITKNQFVTLLENITSCDDVIGSCVTSCTSSALEKLTS